MGTRGAHTWEPQTFPQASKLREKLLTNEQALAGTYEFVERFEQRAASLHAHSSAGVTGWRFEWLKYLTEHGANFTPLALEVIRGESCETS